MSWIITSKGLYVDAGSQQPDQGDLVVLTEDRSDAMQFHTKEAANVYKAMQLVNGHVIPA